MLGNLYDAFLLPYAPPPAATLRFTLAYHETGDGGIDKLALIVDNSNAGVIVVMQGVDLETVPTGSGKAVLLGRRFNNDAIRPGEVSAYGFCSNCIGANTYTLSNLPITASSETIFTFAYFTTIAGQFTPNAHSIQIPPSWRR